MTKFDSFLLLQEYVRDTTSLLYHRFRDNIGENIKQPEPETDFLLLPGIETCKEGKFRVCPWSKFRTFIIIDIITGTYAYAYLSNRIFERLRSFRYHKRLGF